MNQITIPILHQDYVLTCPEGKEAQLREAVERVDQQFEQLRANGRMRSRERVGVLLAVNLAYENLELRNQLQALQTQVAAQQPHMDSDEEDASDTSAALEIQSLEIQALQAQVHSLQAQAAHDAWSAEQLIARLDEVLTPQQADEEALNDDVCAAAAADVAVPTACAASALSEPAIEPHPEHAPPDHAPPEASQAPTEVDAEAASSAAHSMVVPTESEPIDMDPTAPAELPAAAIDCENVTPDPLMDLVPGDEAIESTQEVSTNLAH